MSIEPDMERDWIKLNEYEMNWRAKRDNLAIRDFERRPWTVEDQNAVLDTVRFMSGAIERIEMRQAVLYRMIHANLKETRSFWHSAVVAGMVLAALWAYKSFTHQ